MKQKLRTSMFTGIMIASAGTILMLILLAANLVGPESVKGDNLMYGGTILFIFLYIFLLAGVFLSLLKTKRSNDGKLYFAEGLKIGFLTSLSTAIFSVIFTIIFYELVYPDYNFEMIEVITQKVKQSGLSKDEIHQKIAEQERYYSTGIQAQFSFVGNLITGTAFTVLLALFLKTRKNTIKNNNG